MSIWIWLLIIYAVGAGVHCAKAAYRSVDTRWLGAITSFFFGWLVVPFYYGAKIVKAIIRSIRCGKK